jgi:site-specific DNA-methyltransferase (adenine-specific)
MPIGKLRTDMIDITNECNMKLMARYEDKHFDLAIVDPPYGYGDAKTDILNFRQTEQHREWNIAPNDDYFKELFRVSKNQIIWGGNYFPFIWGFGGRCFIYWHKGNPVPNFADGEMAWTSFDKNAVQIDYRYYGNIQGNTSAEKKIHPTQKPIQLYERVLMKFAEEGNKILDTHLGSGSIVIACHNLGFNLTACELDTEYYEASLKRLKQHQSQLTIF